MPQCQHPVPPPLLVHIGDITVSFALLEHMIQSLVWLLLMQDQTTGSIVTAELAFKNLRALAFSLYKDRYGDTDADFTTFKELLKRADVVEQKRNQVIHSLWAAGDGPDSVTRIKTTAREKDGIKSTFHTVGEDFFKEIAVEMRTLAFDFQQFQTQLRFIRKPFLTRGG